MRLKKILIPLVLFVTIYIWNLPVQAAANEFHRMDIHINVNEDGSAQVTETWNITVVEGTEVYKEINNMEGSLVHSLSVTEGEIVFENLPVWDVAAAREVKQYKSGLVTKGDNYELCFGVGEYGSHTYIMKYTIDNFVHQYSDMYGMNYQLVGASMNVKPDEVYVRIDSPQLTADTIVYAFGFEGKINPREAEGIYYIEAQNELDDGGLGRVNYVNILAGFEGASFTSANQKYVDRTFSNMVAEAKEGSDYPQDKVKGKGFFYSVTVLFRDYGGIIFMSLLIIMRIGSLLYRNRDSIRKTVHSNKERFKDMPKYKDIPYFRDIPCNGNMFLFYYIVKKNQLILDEETAQSGLLAGVLLSWLKAGNISFVKDQKKVLFFNKDIFRIHFESEPEAGDYLTDSIFKYFRQAAGENDILENKEFERWCSANSSKIEGWFAAVDLKMERELVHLGYMEQIPVTKKIFFVFPYQTTEIRYTRAYKEEVTRIMGFKKFLQEFGRLNEKRFVEVALWEDYLIFASILDLADQVEKEIGRLYPAFSEQSNLDVFYTTFATRAFVTEGISRLYRGSSGFGGGGSSSFSGGGGSFSGGGGGGVR